MEQLPLLSVIVPVYQVEAYLDRCLQSITGQTYENLEILLVDDGSPDGSGALCDAWVARDSRIRVIHQENAGAGAARNRALDAAKGEFIGFVDSDDYLAPEMYQYLYSLMDGETDIAECGYQAVTEDNVSFPETETEAVRYTPAAAMASLIEDTCFRQLIWNKLYRRETVGAIRFPEGTVIDDEFFTYRVIGNARGLVHSEKICYAYRQQPDSVMHQKYSLKRLKGIQAKRERLEYLREHMPELMGQAEYELLFACLFHMQSALRSLEPEALSQAEGYFRETIQSLEPLPKDVPLTRKRRALALAARKNLRAAAAALNFLQDIHLLK